MKERKMPNMEKANIRELALQATLNREDTFRFRCTECGKCCKNREDILLSPYDLNRMARHLGIEMGQVIQDYCIWYAGQSSMLPVVTMRMRGPEKRCPFLKGKKCGIHAAKPTVCALFPLGRVGSENDEQVHYMMQKVDCGAADEEHSVQEWLAGYDLADSEKWFLEWQQVLIPLTKRMHALFSGFSREFIASVAEGLLVTLYVNYDSKLDFMEQFRMNKEKANQFLDMIETTMKMYGRV